MSSNISNQASYVRTTRQFPEDDTKKLSQELNKAYLDIANSVNTRTIGLYTYNQQVVTGEEWYLTSKKQQTFRKLFILNSSSVSTPIDHNIKNLSNSGGTTRIHGSFYDGTYYYPLPYVDAVSATNQINVKVSDTQIILTAGAGTPPTIQSGYLVIEWLSQI